MNALVVQSISKTFGGIKALEDINLIIEIGERHGLIGPNGAGKTTLFNLISGVFPPSYGSVFLFDQDITHMRPHKRASLGLGRTYQMTRLFSRLTVEENVLIGLMALDRVRFSVIRPIPLFPELVKRRDELLDIWELWEKRNIRVCDLSYGEQRKLEIILALTPKPKLILLDEPTAGLSALEIEMVYSTIKALPKDITLLVIEHNMDVASNLVNRVTVLNVGKILDGGTWDDIRRNPQVQDIYLGGIPK